MRMPPSYHDGFLYVGDSEFGNIHKVRVSDGLEITSGNWPVHANTEDPGVGEVFANIAIGQGDTLYVNSEDSRIWAIDSDTGAVRLNNVEFEAWGSDPLARAEGLIIVMAEIDGAGRVVAIEDFGTYGEIIWQSEEITTTLIENETNVAIGANGQIYVTSGDRSSDDVLRLWALNGKPGVGLDTVAPWPKYMKNIANSRH